MDLDHKLTKTSLEWALRAAADAVDQLDRQGISLRAIGNGTTPPTIPPQEFAHELRRLSTYIRQSTSVSVVGLKPDGGIRFDADFDDYETGGPQLLQRQEPRKPARTFDPVSVAVGSKGARDEALELLGEIAPHYAKLNDRAQGFVRGMRDKLLREDTFQPSDAQMDWMRSLAAGGWRGGKRR